MAKAKLLFQMETWASSVPNLIRVASTGPTAMAVSVAMAKRLVTDVSFEVSNTALQILGGYGYLEEYGIEKIVRDLRVHQILEGTNEIMRVIIARAILSE